MCAYSIYCKCMHHHQALSAYSALHSVIYSSESPLCTFVGRVSLARRVITLSALFFLFCSQRQWFHWFHAFTIIHAQWDTFRVNHVLVMPIVSISYIRSISRSKRISQSRFWLLRLKTCCGDFFLGISVCCNHRWQGMGGYCSAQSLTRLRNIPFSSVLSHEYVSVTVLRMSSRVGS